MSGRSPMTARMMMGAAAVPLTVIARRQDWLYVPPCRMSSSPGFSVFATFSSSSWQWEAGRGAIGMTAADDRAGVASSDRTNSPVIKRRLMNGALPACSRAFCPVLLDLLAPYPFGPVTP
jgi:hypothetical protein